MAYQIVAVRDNETVRYERNSMLIAIAKARVWASEGWEVSITDDEARTLESAEFERAFRREFAGNFADSGFHVPIPTLHLTRKISGFLAKFPAPQNREFLNT